MSVCQSFKQDHSYKTQLEMIDDESDTDLESASSDSDMSSIEYTKFSIDLPPVTYMANVIANQLIKTGDSLYGRREDANCVLNVGSMRFHVHVQMLA
ncbi:hypothetical protein BX616_008887, partial [Lobosporangium transversale]